MKVFIADDSALMRERLVAMLSELPGLDIVGQARDGVEALDSIQKLSPDTVILDIRMPKKCGLEVLRAIKSQQRTPLVIIFTSYPYPQYRDTCLKAGADFFLDKSHDLEQLLRVLTDALAQNKHTSTGGKLCIHIE